MLFNDILSGIKQLDNPTINLLMVMVLVWSAGVLFRKIKQPPVLGAYPGKMNMLESTVVACAMNGRGAVELVIASIGLELGIINNVFFSILVVIAFLTTLFPPITLNFLLNRKGRDGLVPIES